MHGTGYRPDNRCLLIVDPWGNVLVAPGTPQVQIGWDGAMYYDAMGRQVLLSPRNQGRSVAAGRVEDTRGL